VPTIHRLGAIRICMYWDGHNPPHFHALFRGGAVQIKIADLSVLHGTLPPAALRRVMGWTADQQDFLAAEWARRHGE
jgi:hypothetical protein